eukprot:gene10267-21424_t
MVLFVGNRFPVVVIIVSSFSRQSIAFMTNSNNSSTFTSSFSESNLFIEPRQLENFDISPGFQALILSIVLCPAFVVKYFLNSGVSVQTLDFDGIIISPIFVATYFRRKDIIKLLINHGADINGIQLYNNSILEIASLIMSDYDIYQFLIDNGADINRRDHNGKSELLRACAANDKKAVELLINAGADINVKSESGLTPLTYSILNDKVSPDILDLILEGRADVDGCIGDEDDGFTLLHMTVHNGNVNLINKLLQSGADINAVDKKGRSVLHYLFWGKVGEYTTTSSPEVFISFLENLLDKGAKIFGDNEGRSPLDPYYMRHFDSNIMQLLIDRSENNIEYRDHNGRSLLFRWASMRNLEAVKLLIDNGADIDAVTETRRCGLIVPILNNDTALLELYLQYEFSDRNMAISMIRALMEGRDTCADMIFKRSSPLARQEALAQLVYRHVSNTPSLDLIRRLLEMGADPNLTGIMPLGHHLNSPSLSNKSDLVQLLLEFGADPDSVAAIEKVFRVKESVAESVVEEISGTYEELTVRVVVDAVGLHDIIALFDENHDRLVASRAPLCVCTLLGPVWSLGSDWLCISDNVQWTIASIGLVGISGTLVNFSTTPGASLVVWGNLSSS